MSAKWCQEGKLGSIKVLEQEKSGEKKGEEEFFGGKEKTKKK
jgi:hypothetical protein